MAGIPEAKVKVSLDSTKVKSGSKEAVQSFEKMAGGAKTSMGKIDARTNKTANNLKQVGQEGKQAGSKVKQGADKGAQGLNKLGIEAKKVERDIGGIAISVLGLGASVTGLSDTIFGMKEKLVAIERSTFGLERTTEDMKRMQEDFDQAVKEGTWTAQEHARAIKDLELGYKDMAVEQREVQAEQEAMNSEWISFAVNTATTVVFSITTITMALGAETKAKIASAVAGVILTKSTKAFAKSLWLIVKHPVFLVVAGALAIWESNLFGVRSEVEKLVGMGDLGILSNIEKAFDSGIPEASATTVDSLEDIEKQALQLSDTLEDTSFSTQRGIIPSIEEIGNCSVKTTSKVDNLSLSIDNLKKKQQIFQKDSVASEIAYFEQVKRIRKLNGSSRAIESGLFSNVVFKNQVGGEWSYGSDSALLRSAKGADHWNGGRQNPLGGQADSAMASQLAYNKSISDGSAGTSGWSPEAMQSLRNIKEETSRTNARLAEEHYSRLELQRINKSNMYQFADDWGIRMPKGTNFPKAWRRGLGGLVNKVKSRISYVQNLGYGTPSSEEELQRAEAKIESDRKSWITRSGLNESTVIQYHESGKMTDIYNVINHRQRLGIISSGVI